MNRERRRKSKKQGRAPSGQKPPSLKTVQDQGPSPEDMQALADLFAAGRLAGLYHPRSGPSPQAGLLQSDMRHGGSGNPGATIVTLSW